MPQPGIPPMDDQQYGNLIQALLRSVSEATAEYYRDKLSYDPEGCRAEVEEQEWPEVWRERQRVLAILRVAEGVYDRYATICILEGTPATIAVSCVTERRMPPPPAGQTPEETSFRRSMYLR